MIRKENADTPLTDDELDLLDDLGFDPLDIEPMTDLHDLDPVDCEVEWSTDGSEDLFDTCEMVAFIDG